MGKTKEIVPAHDYREMKSWVFTFRIEPPAGQVLSARNGQNVFFAAYSRALRQWFMVVPGHSEERIAEPQMIFVDRKYAKAHEKDFSLVGRRPSIRLREGKRKVVQYELAL